MMKNMHIDLRHTDVGSDIGHIVALALITCVTLGDWLDQQVSPLPFIGI